MVELFNSQVNAVMLGNFMYTIVYWKFSLMKFGIVFSHLWLRSLYRLSESKVYTGEISKSMLAKRLIPDLFCTFLAFVNTDMAVFLGSILVISVVRWVALYKD